LFGSQYSFVICVIVFQDFFEEHLDLFNTLN